MKQAEVIALTLAWIDTGCWVICFWWMHRLSARQERMLKELHEVTSRIERLSEMEHDMIREVHPAVEKIKEDVKGVAEAVTADDATSRRQP